MFEKLNFMGRALVTFACDECPFIFGRRRGERGIQSVAASEPFDVPLKVAAMMRGFGRSWFVAGGWAVDLYLGELTRRHGDIEVAVFREDQAALRDYFGGRRWRKMVEGVASEWRKGEVLRLPVHELYCSDESEGPNEIEFLLNESDGRGWVYRRDARVARALDRCGMSSAEGVRFLCPEVVLLYKSKNPRPKDERDFEAVASRLGVERRAWLREALEVCDPGHEWIRELEG